MITPIDLIPFCDADSGFPHYTLQKPFVQSGKWCATDGLVAVAIDAWGAPESIDGRYPRIVDLVVFRQPIEAWLDLPPRDVPPCQCECKGTGYINERCECVCGHEHTRKMRCQCHTECIYRSTAGAAL